MWIGIGAKGYHLSNWLANTIGNVIILYSIQLAEYDE
jgi:hypothetical protein